ncbi:MAG: serine/threonine protein kinase [Gemmataceae bacterium]|nr:serine/threonine protein kinase [Gemmataceae bacterium]
MADRDDVLERFEEAWQQGPAPALAAFLPPVHAGSAPARDAACKRLFHELVKIDLEYRWRRHAADAIHERDLLPRCPRLEDYVALFQGLGGLSDLPLDLIGEEYRVRQRWGDRPTHAEYAGRFPALATPLRDELARIDRELIDERGTQHHRGAPAPAATTSSTLRCPHCHHALDVPADRLPSVSCSVCGGAFQIEALSAHGHGSARPPFARLGRYELGDLLGAGGFGSVWRAWDTELKRAVAVKLPRSGQVLGPADEERFLREARAAARLHHPHIVAVHDVGRDCGTLYLVSELVHGVSLAHWLKERRLSFVEAARLTADIAGALDFAHRQGVIHRDVKPSNIMLEVVSGGVENSEDSAARRTPVSAHHSPLTTHYSPRLMDFGLALRHAGEITMTLDGQVLGTPAYISPEQLRNPHAVDGRSDVYSLGVILYELLTGELPFRGMTRMVLDQVLLDEPPPPRRLNDRIPRDLETICLKCLAKEPSGRYQSAAALAADLGRWLDGRPIAARPAGWARRGWLWVRRNPAAALVTGIAGVALATTVGVPTALVVLGLMLVVVVSLFLAVRNATATGELTATVALAVEDQQRTAAALQYALQNCLQAREERDRAVAERDQASRRFQLLRGLAKAWIFELPQTLPVGAGPAPTRSFLVRTALAYLDGLAQEAGADASLVRETAVAYGRVGDLQAEGTATAPGDLAGALATYRKCLELFRALASDHPDNAQAQRDLAASAAKVSDLERVAPHSMKVV